LADVKVGAVDDNWSGVKVGGAKGIARRSRWGCEMKAWMVLTVLVLAACDPQAVVDKAVARTAESVIAPVVGSVATRCVVENGSPDELRAIAVDIGVEAGTSTVANIMEIAQRPQTAACIAQSALAG